VNEFVLYGLRESEKEIRYIGITSKGLPERLDGHMRERFQANPHKHRWFKQIKSRGSFIEIVPLIVGLTKESACKLETDLIAALKIEGFLLVNLSLGGTAPMHGRKSSDQTRIKLRDAWTPERRKAFSNFQTGKRRGPNSLEWNKKISEGNFGKSIPPEVKKQIQKTLTGKLTSRNTSGFVGVSKVGNLWQAFITVNRKTKVVGYFRDLQEAVSARESALDIIKGGQIGRSIPLV
jgi:hypothetical protein